jgi:prepilin-type N-terminal cleavage/methylation domain-containing protein
MKNICNIKKGMTLIEVIISVALLSLLIIPISTMIINSVKTNKKAEIKQKSAYIGQQVLEEIGTYDYVTLTTDGENRFFKLLDGDKIVEKEEGIYEGKVENSNLPTNYEVSVSLKKNINFNYEGENNLLKYKTVPWRFHISNNTFKLYSPASDTGHSDNIITQGTIVDKLIINIDDFTNIKLSNLVGSEGSVSFDKTYGDNNKILLYLTDVNNATYPKIEIRNTGSSNIKVFVLKENDNNKIDISVFGEKVIVYNDLLAIDENKIGELYNINVIILDKDTGEEIFNGYTTSNIIFK